MSRCLIGLGSNVGDRAALLDFAVRRLRETPQIDVVAHSRWIETSPVGGPAGQSPYLNGAAVIETKLAPEAVLDVLQNIEDESGRRRDVRWGPRTLDLDLLLYGRRTLRSPRLTIPHPRMSFRRFVLEPAAEVARDMLHPTTGWKVHWLWRHLLDARRTVGLGGPPSEDKQRLATALCEQLPGMLVRGHEQDFVTRLAGSSPVPAWDVAIEFLRRWRELLVPPRVAATRSSWRVCDFAMADAPAIVRQYSAEAARSCESHLVLLGDAAETPSLTLIIRPAGATDTDVAVLAEVTRLAAGPTLSLDAADWDGTVSEAIAAIRAAE